MTAKGWFLTYPQCDAAKEDLLEFLKTKAVAEKIIVCHELHKDGSHHLHAFIKYDRRIHVSRQDYFNFQGFHPNMQVAKSFFAVSKYVKKGEDFIEEGMDANQEMSARESHKKVLGK